MDRASSSRFTIARILLVTLVFAAAFASSARADQNFGVGIHVGAHHNVGNMDSYDPSMQIKPQTSFLLGCAFKANLGFFFMRAGVDTSFVFSKGEVLEPSSTDTVTSYEIQYSQVPFFAGLRFPVQDVGEFYLGGGGAYLLATGTVKHPAKEEISATAIGYGFLAGMQLTLTPNVRLYMEWEYIDARSAPVLATQVAPADNWKNLYIDFTGHRILLGAMYYLL
jgi:opacity protein-like surface antigen